MHVLDRITAYEKLGLGLFIHWGLYSQLSKGEWIFKFGKFSMDEYQKLSDTFTAEDFDADALACFAKENGFKYIVLTTRHHDGFSLYDTCGLCDFDSPHSRANRDIVREFVDACNKHNVIPFLYHTTIDWYNSDYQNDFDTYLEYLRKSVEVLCTNYGKLGGFWFDGCWDKPNADWHENELYGIIRKYQPNAIIINNTGLSHRGEKGNIELDAVTLEQGCPELVKNFNGDKYIASELCLTMNDHWGVSLSDFNYKSPCEIIEVLCESRKYGSNFLLNTGFEAQGKMPEIQRAYLNIVGRWMKIFGEAIYFGRPYIRENTTKNFILKGEGCLYIFAYNITIDGSENVTVNVEEMPDEYVFENVNDKISEVYWMDNNEPLKFEQDGENFMVNFTKNEYGTNYCVRVAKAILDK